MPDNATLDDTPYLVRRSDGTRFIIDGSHRRQVRSGLIAASLQCTFPDRGDISDSDLDQFADGAPVEVLESSEGPPFLLVAGQRMPVRGLPLPHPVNPEMVERYPLGPEIDVAAANVPRSRLEQARAHQSPVIRLRSSVRNRGLVRTATLVARRTASKAASKAR